MKNNGLQTIAGLICGYRKAKILFTAASLNLFIRTNGRGKTAAGISAALNTDLRTTKIFLDALAGMGFLKKKKDLYSNSPLADKFLVPGKAEYLGNNLCYQDILWEAWADLGKVLRSGRTTFPLRSLLSGRKDFLDGYIKGMANIAGKPAAEIAGKLDLSGAENMLDVGGGPGTYTAAFLNREKQLKGTILDLPETLKVTRGLFAGHSLSSRITFQEGDYHVAPFGREKFDIVLLSHVTHDEGPAENLNLIRKAFSALRSGGQVVIHDFMLDPNMTSPEFSVLFSVHMLVYTNKGRVYSSREYKSWLKEAGFKRVKEWRICSRSDNPSRMILGKKP